MVRAKGLYSDLPKIIAVTEKQDFGEFGAACCPHCNAEGRYIYWFLCDDGSKRGAMAGCFQKFPRHPFASEYKRILDKEDMLGKRGYGDKLASWDIAIRDAIVQFGTSQISEIKAKELIADAKSRKAAWIKSRYGRR